MILIFFATQWRGSVYASGGYPISGATVNLMHRDTKRLFACAVTDPNGRFDFGGYESVYAGGDYTLEVISGAERVTIWGDTGEVEVQTPEMEQERRRREAEAVKLDATPKYRRLFWPRWAKQGKTGE